MNKNCLQRIDWLSFEKCYDWSIYYSSQYIIYYDDESQHIISLYKKYALKLCTCSQN